MKTVKIHDYNFTIEPYFDEEFFIKLFEGTIIEGNEFAKVNNALNLAKRLKADALHAKFENQKRYFYEAVRIRNNYGVETFNYQDHIDYKEARREFMQVVNSKGFPYSIVELINQLI